MFEKGYFRYRQIKHSIAESLLFGKKIKLKNIYVQLLQEDFETYVHINPFL